MKKMMKMNLTKKKKMKMKMNLKMNNLKNLIKIMKMIISHLMMGMNVMMKKKKKMKILKKKQINYQKNWARKQKKLMVLLQTVHQKTNSKALNLVKILKNFQKKGNQLMSKNLKTKNCSMKQHPHKKNQQTHLKEQTPQPPYNRKLKIRTKLVKHYFLEFLNKTVFLKLFKK
ncbi:hypothetical protein PPERSA_03875 [Pseudocohnilembus persalinus]|uniref:Uncharacterized protein n=1 Tax=Pseudocohnilembus persalinus TaxID=266149 RepID=A0A0V0Q9M1_PSEPJ|nr:hypothetical protein PPERSA_03875 [Pseudocohnilembus persalinus]|eukprot:KRW98740.1 hypothetical protein PPERSA_03875 [Pseudocohnilembus persalinus]